MQLSHSLKHRHLMCLLHHTQVCIRKSEVAQSGCQLSCQMKIWRPSPTSNFRSCLALSHNLRSVLHPQVLSYGNFRPKLENYINVLYFSQYFFKPDQLWALNVYPSPGSCWSINVKSYTHQKEIASNN